MSYASMRLAGTQPNAIPPASTFFSVDTYAGNDTTRAVSNGIDLAGEGGVAWIKNRSDNQRHAVFPSAVGLTGFLNTDTRNPVTALGGGQSMVFGSGGFTYTGSSALANKSGDNYAAFSLRNQSAFFDSFTYTGNGTAGRSIAHSLGAVPGLILVKKTNDTADWLAWTPTTQGQYLRLKNDAPTGLTTSGTYWGNGTTYAAPTSSAFTVSSNTLVNANSDEYLVLVFAADERNIKVGTYTGNGSASGPFVPLGFRPAFVMAKNLSVSGSWNMLDDQRKSGSDPNLFLLADRNDAEASLSGAIAFGLSGFNVNTTSAALNTSAQTYFYLAIRA